MIISVLTAMILLFGVHCIADYPFQPDFLAKYKSRFPGSIFVKG